MPRRKIKLQPPARAILPDGRIPHNETRDEMTKIMREAGLIGVEVEPKLQPLSGEVFDLKPANKEDEARSDIECTGVWKSMRQAFFDIKVISYKKYNPTGLYRHVPKL